MRFHFLSRGKEKGGILPNSIYGTLAPLPESVPWDHLVLPTNSLRRYFAPVGPSWCNRNHLVLYHLAPIVPGPVAEVEV